MQSVTNLADWSSLAIWTSQPVDSSRPNQLEVDAREGSLHAVCVCVYVCMFVCMCMYVCVYAFHIIAQLTPDLRQACSVKLEHYWGLPSWHTQSSIEGSERATQSLHLCSSGSVPQSAPGHPGSSLG